MEDGGESWELRTSWEPKEDAIQSDVSVMPRAPRLQGFMATNMLEVLVDAYRPKR